MYTEKTLNSITIQLRTITRASFVCSFPFFSTKFWINCFHFLRIRFKSKLVRRLASATFIVRNVFIMGITMYTPCVALNTVANVPYWASYLLMTILGILFTIFVSVSLFYWNRIFWFYAGIFFAIETGKLESSHYSRCHSRHHNDYRVVWSNCSGRLWGRGSGKGSQNQ